MSTKEVSKNEETKGTSVANLDMKLEVVVIPVSDVDRAKEFYSRLGWRLDADRAAGDNFRLVQFTPPGSGSSIQFGVNLTSAAPVRRRQCTSPSPTSRRRANNSSHKALTRARYFTVRPERLAGFPASACESAGHSPSISATTRSFLSAIPMATAGCCRKLRSGFPGASQATRCMRRLATLPQAMIRAAKEHGQHEKQTGQADPNWPDWYAEYMVREQSGPN